MKKKLLITATITLLTSCSEGARDVQYYIDHPKEREKVIKDCYNNPGEKAGLANCINANVAQEKVAPSKMPSIKGALDNYKK